eukprot:1180876-Prorocentrum_minimum.AAC.4
MAAKTPTGPRPPFQRTAFAAVVNRVDQEFIRTENALCAGSADDDLGAHRGDADLDTGVPILSELTGKELVQLGEEHAISHELVVHKHATKARTTHHPEAPSVPAIRAGSRGLSKGPNSAVGDWKRTGVSTLWMVDSTLSYHGERDPRLRADKGHSALAAPKSRSFRPKRSQKRRFGRLNFFAQAAEESNRNQSRGDYEEYTHTVQVAIIFESQMASF